VKNKLLFNCFIYQENSNQTFNNCLLFFLFCIYVLKGVFSNYSLRGFSTLFNFKTRKFDNININNCAFENITSTSSYPVAVYCSSGSGLLVIYNCKFNNISSSHKLSTASVIYLVEKYSNFSMFGSVFSNISSSFSVLNIQVWSIFCSLQSNYFINITSTGIVGVFFVYFIIFFP
jgi:hypothetical protein